MAAPKFSQGWCLGFHPQNFLPLESGLYFDELHANGKKKPGNWF